MGQIPRLLVNKVKRKRQSSSEPFVTNKSTKPTKGNKSQSKHEVHLPYREHILSGSIVTVQRIKGKP